MFWKQNKTCYKVNLKKRKRRFKSIEKLILGMAEWTVITRDKFADGRGISDSVRNWVRLLHDLLPRKIVTQYCMDKHVVWGLPKSIKPFYRENNTNWLYDFMHLNFIDNKWLNAGNGLCRSELFLINTLFLIRSFLKNIEPTNTYQNSHLVSECTHLLSGAQCVPGWWGEKRLFSWPAMIQDISFAAF